MKRYHDCPQILRDFLTYHETIKGQSQLTISEYYLDLRMFLRFIQLMRGDMPIDTRLDEIDIKRIDLNFVREITTSEILRHSRRFSLLEYMKETLEGSIVLALSIASKLISIILTVFPKDEASSAAPMPV